MSTRCSVRAGGSTTWEQSDSTTARSPGTPRATASGAETQRVSADLRDEPETTWQYRIDDGLPDLGHSVLGLRDGHRHARGARRGEDPVGQCFGIAGRRHVVLPVRVRVTRRLRGAGGAEPEEQGADPKPERRGPGREHGDRPRV